MALNGSVKQALNLKSRIHGCWIGKSIGGTLGLPPEGKTERLSYSFYDPVPTSAPPNDDLELQLVWLHLVELGGSALKREDFARGWLNHIHYMWDEYGRCRWNLRRGVLVSVVGTFENSFASGMGSPIRSEIWACLFPGDEVSAAYYAALDSSLDHGIEGIAGEVFCSVMQSLVAGGTALQPAIEAALDRVPPQTETGRALRLVFEAWEGKMEAWTCRECLLDAHINENFTHAPLNVALILWALLYGNGDFEASILLAVNAGYDTDSTGATVGATLGLLVGVEGLPQRWKEPIGEQLFVGPGIKDLPAPTTLQELTERTMAVIGKLKPRLWSEIDWCETPAEIDAASLPGTIRLLPKGKSAAVPWANGELPVEVKKAGGASWQWQVEAPDEVRLICLAKKGARLFVDGVLLIDCPAGLPYVPATHRCPAPSVITFAAKPGRHEIKVELNSNEESQLASVILAYPDLHLRPWSSEELPARAQLA
jgi:ADP-ribosylglycohydrolase